MSEPWLPVPPPDSDSYHDPNPPHCPECGVILQSVNPMDATGWCPKHNRVLASYSNPDLNIEMSYRLLDGHDAGDGEETCDDGCGKQPVYVRLATGEWVCEEHAR